MTSKLEETLADRGDKYGDFSYMSMRIRSIQKSIHGCCGYGQLAPYQQHALDMIAVKIGRILAGNPDYDDNWRDIAGYATKVLETLDS